MNPEDVKLTKLEELMVVVMTIYYAVPWKYLIIPVLFTILGPTITYYASSKVLVGKEFYEMCGAVGLLSFLFSIIGNLFVFLLGPEIYKSTKSHLTPIYIHSRARAQERAIEKVDDRLLK